ncbi:Uncharacterised protein [Vibrio cholerae]|nr:Uncharacterised protein [Vibrio cholerae]
MKVSDWPASMWLPSTTTSSPSTSVISTGIGPWSVSARKRMPTSSSSTPWNTSAGTRCTRSSLCSPYASSGAIVTVNLSPATLPSNSRSRPVIRLL